jgi:hypothetical protein
VRAANASQRIAHPGGFANVEDVQHEEGGQMKKTMVVTFPKQTNAQVAGNSVRFAANPCEIVTLRLSFK